MALPNTAAGWGWALLSSVLSAAANAALSSLGVTGLNAVLKTPIAPLQWHQLLAVLFSGALVGLLMHFAKTPLPVDLSK